MRSVFGSEVRQFSVDPASQIVWTANLDKSDELSGSISVTGGSGNDLNFWITDPSGGTILDKGRVSQGTSFSLTADISGGHTLHFDNSFSAFSSKLVTLTFDIKKTFLGLPATPSSSLVILLLLALVITVIGGVAYSIWASKKKKLAPVPLVP